MCGIVGFIDFSNRLTVDTLRQMAAPINHRGPDGEGYEVLNSSQCAIGLGHKRLSIIDLSTAGTQPMHYKHWSITFNGEIYNHGEIRKELEQAGYTFDSSSDTAVILRAFDKWGVDAVHKFIGMFAFFIVDRKQHKAYLFRDRTGVKPLYYCVKNSLHIYFASELKCFITAGITQKEINKHALATYLQYGYIQGAESIFSDVKKLLPGCYMQIDLAIGKSIIVRYWSVDDYYAMPPVLMSDTEVMEETEKLLISAAQYRMVADVPVGVFLSGGYDSSLVTALLQHNHNERIKTFTIGFQHQKYNEAEHAKKVATHLNTDHTEYYCSEEDAKKIIPTLGYFFDEPFGDSSAIPTMLVSKLARQKVTVALSADAGDELFIGYNKYDSFSALHKKLNKFPLFINRSLGNLLQNFPAGISSYTKERQNSIEAMADILSNNSSLTDINKYATRRVSDKSLKSLLTKEYLGKSSNENWDSKIASNDLNSLLAIDYKTYLVDDILTKVDRATMSVSLEGREPLLDHRILEFIARIPTSQKYRNGVKKYILKEITHKYIPKNLMERPKMGFAIPLNNWFRTDLAHYLEDFLSEDRIVKQGIFNNDKVQQLLSLYKKGNDRDFEQIWFLLVFQLWYEKWMKN